MSAQMSEQSVRWSDGQDGDEMPYPSAFEDCRLRIRSVKWVGSVLSNSYKSTVTPLLAKLAT